MGFAASKLFNSDSPEAYKPFESPETMRKRFSPDTKLMIAIGGWGDTAGFSEGAKDEASRTRYAKNVASMLDEHGFDGVGKISKQTFANFKVASLLTFVYRYRLGISRRQRSRLQRRAEFQESGRDRNLPSLP